MPKASRTTAARPMGVQPKKSYSTTAGTCMGGKGKKRGMKTTTMHGYGNRGSAKMY